MAGYGYLHRGVVTGRDDTGGYHVRITALAPGRIMGPFPSLLLGLEPGDRVAVASIGTSRDDLVIVGRLLRDTGYDLDTWLTSFAARISPAQSYREPTGPEAVAGVSGVEKLALADQADEAAALLVPLGFAIVRDVDLDTRRPFALAVCENGTDRSWGAFLVDLSRPVRLVVQCPHIVADQHSELLALDHWRRTPGALLVIAGAHRDATGTLLGGYPLADVGKQAGSLFHLVCAAFASRSVPAVQWHGFADASAPGLTHVVATGSGAYGRVSRRIAEELGDGGFSVGRGWDSSGSETGLIGLTNVQGDDAADKGVTWTHVEVNATTRGNAATRAATVDAVVAAAPEEAGPTVMLADTRPGQYPNAVGSVNTVGDSEVAARSDHIHAERAATLTRIDAVEATTAGHTTTLTAHTTTLTAHDGRITGLEISPFRSDRDLYGDAVSTMPRDRAVNAIPLTNGTLYAVRMFGRPSMLLSSIRLATAVAGVAGTANVALFVGSSVAALSRARTSTINLAALGRVTYTFSSSYTVNAEYHMVIALLPKDYTTAPQMGGVTGVVHSTLLNPSSSFYTSLTKAGVTEMPTTLDLTDGTWTTTVTSKMWAAVA